MEDRLTNLEVLISHQDATIAALDGVVRTLGDEVAKLRREIAELKAGRDQTIQAPSEPPPHY